LQLYGRRAGRGFGDVDVGLAISAALRGLVQSGGFELGVEDERSAVCGIKPPQ
jgi:hypothetical protein